MLGKQKVILNNNIFKKQLNTTINNTYIDPTRQKLQTPTVVFFFQNILLIVNGNLNLIL